MWGGRVFVGRTSRTDDAGITQLRAELAPFGYAVRVVDVTGCLHLKSAVTAVDDRTVLLNPAWVDARSLRAARRDRRRSRGADGGERPAVGDALVYGDAYPLTRARLEARGYRVHAVPATEIAKAEGAVTCCSLVLRA